jgi:hypothetical protein
MSSRREPTAYNRFQMEALRVIRAREPTLPQTEVMKRAVELWLIHQAMAATPAPTASSASSTTTCLAPVTLEELHAVLDRLELAVAFTLTGTGTGTLRVVVASSVPAEYQEAALRSDPTTLTVPQARFELEGVMERVRDGDLDASDARLELAPLTLMRVLKRRASCRGQRETVSRVMRALYDEHVKRALKSVISRVDDATVESVRGGRQVHLTIPPLVPGQTFDQCKESVARLVGPLAADLDWLTATPLNQGFRAAQQLRRARTLEELQESLDSFLDGEMARMRDNYQYLYA